jgi:four helix bundle protein
VGNPSNLVVLDKAHALLERVNEAVTSIRQSHLGDLKKQLMKSALSIPSNIAEGRRKTSKSWTSYLTWQNVRTKSGK